MVVGGGGRRGAARRAGGGVVVGSGAGVGWVCGVVMAHLRALSFAGVDWFRLLGGGGCWRERGEGGGGA